MHCFLVRKCIRLQRPLLLSSGKERPRPGFDDAAAGLVLIQRSLERTDEKVTFGSVVVDDSKPTVGATVIANEPFTHAGNNHFLPVENKDVAFYYFGVVFVFRCLPFTCF